ncbi:hypothetical protein [Paenibacillus alkalitolerans]|uniref:hypothetical protein n=1 Tax=Paenibacillus alkalitolerans TaxID=2799335 RepID=UPI002D810B9F|nr:hypothetical protein [Paenibacillus alkalitolerans]
MIGITVMIKNGGYQTVKISPEMVGKLAISIKEKGFEYVQLLSGAIEVVGFLVTGDQTGDRIIVLGEKARENA